MIDKEKAVSRFLERVDWLDRLPLITDAEMDDLFGDEVAAALAELDRRNQEEELCLHCDSRCCLACRCELYVPRFSRCPIQGLRPVLCRLHFCDRFRVAGSSLMDDLGDIFFESLLAADREGDPRVRLFEAPPLVGSAPDLIAVVSPWVKAVREGTLAPRYAGKAVHREAKKHRTPACGGAPLEAGASIEAGALRV